jgi:hypothetical protein
VRNTLLCALEFWADPSQRHKTHQFLTGLSCDELEYIADFLGATVLEPMIGGASRQQQAELVAFYQRARGCCTQASEDYDRKAILLLEYLCCGGAGRLQPAASGSA